MYQRQRMTPDFIRFGVQFTTRWLRRGYDETEVDDFLDEVADHVELLMRRVTELEAQLPASAQARVELHRQEEQS